MAALQQIFGTPPLPIHRFVGSEATVGRHEDCDVVVDSPAVSRCHAKITCENQRYFIEDLNSRNGTTVNAKRIHSRTLLNDGDLVDIATLPFRFLSQDAVNEDSGDWNAKADVIRLAHAADDDHSARRMLVQPGDQVTSEELGTEPLRPSQVIGRIQVADGGGAWPVVDQAAMKLNQTLRLLHALRQTATRDQVISQTAQELFDAFPAAERISIVLRHDQPTSVQVVAAASRRPADDVQICLPVIRTAMQNCEALLYTEHWRSRDSGSPDGVVGTVLVTPLVGLLGHSIGAIQLDCSENNHALTTDDLERLVVLSLLVSFVLEQAEAMESRIAGVIRERDALDANQRQAEFRPATPPVVPGYRLAHEFLAGASMSGGHVDYQRLPDGRVACVVIDVPGRDTEAAQWMALLSGLLAGALSESGAASTAILDAERALCERGDEIPEQISVAILVLDRERSEVTVSVAGCCPLYLIRATELQEVTAVNIVGPVLGAGRPAAHEGKIQLNDNEILLVLSDGITQLASAGGQVLTGAQRLALIADAASENRTVFESRLKRRLRDFCGAESSPETAIFAMIHRHKDAGTIDAQGLRGIDADTMAT